MAPLLPMEIVQLIIDELRPGVANALRISGISQHWRAIALSTPSLWSTFSFCLRAQYVMELLPAFFDRSLPNSLDITVTLNFQEKDTSGMIKVQRAIVLLCGEADRVERLHLHFLSPMHEWKNILMPLVHFRSSSLKYLDMEALINRYARELLMDNFLGMYPSRPCPALTHVTCTDTRMFIQHPARSVTYLCIKGVPSRRNVINFNDLWHLLLGTPALTELLIDGVSLEKAGRAISLPHLHTLSLRSPLRSNGRVSLEDTMMMASFLRSLNTPALTSLTIPGLYHGLGLRITTFPNFSIPSVTRFAVVSSTVDPLFHYPLTLPGVTELVFLGSDPELCGIVGLPAESWPNLCTIDLTNLEYPPPQRLRGFCESLCIYGRERFKAGHVSRVAVRFPQGVSPQDLPPDVGQFMDLHTTQM